jgi:hypothetical protein
VSDPLRSISWRDIALILFLEAFSDVLLDKFVKAPAMWAWGRFLDWLREARQRRKGGAT